VTRATVVAGAQVTATVPQASDTGYTNIMDKAAGVGARRRCVCVFACHVVTAIQ